MQKIHGQLYTNVQVYKELIWLNVISFGHRKNSLYTWSPDPSFLVIDVRLQTLVRTLNDSRGLIDLASGLTDMVDNDITVHENSNQFSTTVYL